MNIPEELATLRALRDELTEILEAKQAVADGVSLAHVAKDRMEWRARHAKEAEQWARKSNDNWQRMKHYEQALISVIDAANAMPIAHAGEQPPCGCSGCHADACRKQGAQRVASLARNALGAILTERGFRPL